MLEKFITFTKLVLKDYVSSRNLPAYLKKLCKRHQNQQGHAGLHTKSMERAMEIILANYSIFMAHIESLSQRDSQALK